VEAWISKVVGECSEAARAVQDKMIKHMLASCGYSAHTHQNQRKTPKYVMKLNAVSRTVAESPRLANSDEDK
jgi:hypothetical protein